MKRSKTIRPIPILPEKCESAENGINEVKNGKREGENLPFEYRNTEHPPVDEITAGVQDELARNLCFIKKPKTIDIRQRILEGEIFLVQNRNTKYDIKAGTILEVEYPEGGSNFIQFIINEERGQTRRIMIDLEVLAKDTIRFAELEVN